MNLLIVIFALVACSNAVTCTSASTDAACTPSGARICCTAPGASTCTTNIPDSLCRKAGGSWQVAGTTPTGVPGATCCCFGRDASGADKCLPNVLETVCLGISVQGRCQPKEDEKCCCLPPGTVSTLDCIPRIPKPLCDKAGATCITDPTPAPNCNCIFNRGTPQEVTQELDAATCLKFKGEVVCDAERTCCCIPKTNQNPNPNPADLNAPCVENTPVSQCTLTGRKRSGVCRGATAPTPSPAPRCRCQDPNAPVGTALPGDANEEILVHVCVQKQGSTCIPNRCCCKYPSAPDDQCILGTSVDRCSSVNAAVCLSIAPLPQQCPTNPNLFRFGANLDVRVTRTLPAGATAQQNADVQVKTISSLRANGVNVPIFDVNTFDIELQDNSQVFTNFLGGTTTIAVNNPAKDFVLFLINLPGSTEANAPNEYIINIRPATGLTLGYRGSVDGGGRTPILEAVAATPGQWRLRFANTRPINGIISFINTETTNDLRIETVSITYPPRRTGSVNVATVALSGVVPSFRSPTTTTNNAAPQIVLPAAPTAPVILNPVTGAAANPQPPLIENLCFTNNVIANALANAANFAVLPAANTLRNLNPAVAINGAGNALTSRFQFPAGTGEDQGLFFIVDWDLTAGDTIAFAPENAGGSAVVFSGLTGGTLANNVFTVTTTGTFNGIVRIPGTHTFLDVTITDADGVLRRRTDITRGAAGTGDCKGNCPANTEANVAGMGAGTPIPTAP